MPKVTHFYIYRDENGLEFVAGLNNSLVVKKVLIDGIWYTILWYIKKKKTFFNPGARSCIEKKSFFYLSLFYRALLLLSETAAAVAEEAAAAAAAAAVVTSCARGEEIRVVPPRQSAPAGSLYKK